MTATVFPREMPTPDEGEPMQTRHTAELVPAATEGRDEFTTVELAIDLDGAEKAVRSAINGLATSSTEEGLKFRTTDGM